MARTGSVIVLVSNGRSLSADVPNAADASLRASLTGLRQAQFAPLAYQKAASSAHTPAFFWSVFDYSSYLVATIGESERIAGLLARRFR